MDPTPTLIDAFKGNPTWMSLALMMGCAGFTVTVIAIVLVAKKIRGAALFSALTATGLGALAIAAGLTGMIRGHALTDEAASTPGLSATDRVRIVAAGGAEASWNLKLALAVGSLPLVAGVALTLASLRLRKS